MSGHHLIFGGVITWTKMDDDTLRVHLDGLPEYRTKVTIVLKKKTVNEMLEAFAKKPEPQNGVPVEP